METGPAVSASEAGSRKTPEPIMLPTTRAVAIHRPMERLSLGERMRAPFLEVPRSSRARAAPPSGSGRGAAAVAYGRRNVRRERTVTDPPLEELRLHRVLVAVDGSSTAEL